MRVKLEYGGGAQRANREEPGGAVLFPQVVKEETCCVVLLETGQHPLGVERRSISRSSGEDWMYWEGWM